MLKQQKTKKNPQAMKQYDHNDLISSLRVTHRAIQCYDKKNNDQIIAKVGGRSCVLQSGNRKRKIMKRVWMLEITYIKK